MASAADGLGFTLPTCGGCGLPCVGTQQLKGSSPCLRCDQFVQLSWLQRLQRFFWSGR